MSKPRYNNNGGRPDDFKKRSPINKLSAIRSVIDYPIDTLQSDPEFELDIDEGDDEDTDDSEEDDFDNESSP